MQQSVVCIFELSRLVASFNSTCTEEIALYNLSKVVYVFVISIDGLSRAKWIV